MAHGNFDTVSPQGYDARSFFSEDLLNGDKGYAVGPVRALMSALLFDGVQSFMNFACADTPAHRNRYQEAHQWVSTRGSEYIFAFDSVCEALGVDPDFLRYGLLNACNSQTYEWKKTRRNF